MCKQNTEYLTVSSSFSFSMTHVGTEKNNSVFGKEQNVCRALTVQTSSGEKKNPPLNRYVMGNTGDSFENIKKCSV